MKKERNVIKVLLLLVIGLIGLNSVNALSSYKYYVHNEEKLVFTVPLDRLSKIKSIIDEKLDTSCYDENKIKTTDMKFVCKTEWDGKTKSGCGLVRKNYDKFKGNCFLRIIGNENVGINMNFQAYKYNIYPTDLDTSNKFYTHNIQNKELSCESSATADILSTLKNRLITEDDVISKLPRSLDQQAAKWVNGKRIWGNPDEGFVGYIDKYPLSGKGALQWRYEGYGVNEPPIAKVYNDYGIKTEIINDANRKSKGLYTQKEHLTRLLEEIAKGNYVQLWGDTCTYPEFEDGKSVSGKLTDTMANNGYSDINSCVYPYRSRVLTWYYKDKNGDLKEFKGLNGEHAFYLLGYKGGTDNPTHITVWDTNTGKHTYPTKEWLRKWAKMQDRSIIAYK